MKHRGRTILIDGEHATAPAALIAAAHEWLEREPDAAAIARALEALCDAAWAAPPAVVAAVAMWRRKGHTADEAAARLESIFAAVQTARRVNEVARG
jgi:hypothetical protein